jgi:hypothetical protein
LGILAEIGYADALLARELPDGRLQLIDGHLRAESTPDALVPVLVLDLDDTEALKLLATLDPLASLAETDHGALQATLADVTTENAAVAELWRNLLATPEPASLAAPDDSAEPDRAGRDLVELYQLLVECSDEQSQQDLFERLRSEGYQCRVLNL